MGVEGAVLGTVQLYLSSACFVAGECRALWIGGEGRDMCRGAVEARIKMGGVVCLFICSHGGILVLDLLYCCAIHIVLVCMYDGHNQV